MTSKEKRTKRLEQLKAAGKKAAQTLQNQSEEFSGFMGEVKNKWGGRRKNQTGRPKTFGAEKATENVAFKLPPSYATLLDQKRVEGESRGKAARRILLAILQQSEQQAKEENSGPQP